MAFVRIFVRESRVITFAAATTAVSARSTASLLAAPPVIQPPQENPMTVDAGSNSGNRSPEIDL
jgi:hypothetical protein